MCVNVTRNRKKLKKTVTGKKAVFFNYEQKNLKKFEKNVIGGKIIKPPPIVVKKII